jgi:hypothetical protein
MYKEKPMIFDGEKEGNVRGVWTFIDKIVADGQMLNADGNIVHFSENFYDFGIALPFIGNY